MIMQISAATALALCAAQGGESVGEESIYIPCASLFAGHFYNGPIV